MPRMKQEKRDAARSKLPIRLLKGGVVAVVFAVAALAGVALLVSGGLLSRTMADKSILTVCLLGALVGGLYVLGRSERGVLLVGAGVGAIEWLLLLIVGAICFGGFGGVGGMIGPAIGCLCGGVLAGVLRALRGSQKQKGDYRK